MIVQRRSVLVVDDEVLFLRTVVDGFQAYADRFELLTAHNGREALFILGGRRIDLVITDLRMPEMDGFELLAAMSRSYPDTPVLVMTAFGTPEIDQRLRGLGVEHYLEKPLEFRVLARRVLDALSLSASGAVSGITLASFLQIIALDRKSCVLRISSRGRTGHMTFEHGVLVDARSGDLNGDAAGLEIVCWEDADIEILPPQGPVPHTVQLSLTAILMEGIQHEDEKRRDEAVPQHTRTDRAAAATPPHAPPFVPPTAKRTPQPPTVPAHAPPPPPKTETKAVPSAVAAESPPPGPTLPAAGEKEIDMSAKEKLQELANIDGFAGAAVFTPTGEELALLAGSVTNIKEVGVLANNVLMNAQKASLEMGAGRGQLVHVEGEKAHILVRCMNEGTDPLKSQPGRAHIHTVLVLKPEASIGMAKLKIGQVVEKLAEDFR